MEAQFIHWTMVILHLTMLHATTAELITWCGDYETFCLFHDKSWERVPNLSAAQERCNDSRQGSWPLEITDERIDKIVQTFISNNSISEIVLNAVEKSGKWYWIKENTGNLQY